MLERIAAFLTTVDGRSAAGAAVAVIAVVVAGSFIGVKAGAELWDPAGPTTVRFNLKEGQQEVRGDQRLILVASRPLPVGRVRQALHFEPAADGALTASGDGQTFSWLPASTLADRTAYTVRLDSMPKVDGHRVRGGVLHFRTTTTPRVIGVTLASGTPVEGGQIPLGAGLELTFNTAMETGSVKLLANGSPLGLSWAADRRSAKVEGTALKAGRLSLETGPGGHDAGGRNLAAWRLAAIVVERPQDAPPLPAPALVQIANDAAARDQSGLQSADAVYEYLTEGGITRFTAIFSRAPDVVGPVNSGRPISLKLARHLRGMLFMSDLSRGSGTRLAADPVPTSLDSPGVFYRSDARSAPDNLYAHGASLQQAEQRLHVPPSGLPTGGTPLAAGAAGTEVTVTEHRSNYSYDSSSHTYSKTEEGRLVQDAALSGAPIQIQLLVVLHTTATPTSYAEDGAGHRGLDFDLDTGGQADFYSGGLHASGRWAAPQRQGDLRFTLDSGTQVEPPGGLTWFDVVTS